MQMGLPKNRTSMLVFKWLLKTNKHCPWASMPLPMKQHGLFWTSPWTEFKSFQFWTVKRTQKMRKRTSCKILLDSCRTGQATWNLLDVCWMSTGQRSATPRYNSPARVPALQCTLSAGAVSCCWEGSGACYKGMWSRGQPGTRETGSVRLLQLAFWWVFCLQVCLPFLNNNMCSLHGVYITY